MSLLSGPIGRRPGPGPKSRPGNGDAVCGNDAALHPERADGSLPPHAQVGPWASVGFNLGRISPLLGQKEERADVDCRSRAPALPQPSKWLPATMIPKRVSEVYLRLTGKWANIRGKLLKVTPMQPENFDPQTGIPGGLPVVSSWYEEGVLGICPECGQQTLLPPNEMAEPATICLTCGALDVLPK
jgi:hypothetical protein